METKDNIQNDSNLVLGYSISSIEITDKKQETFMSIFNDVSSLQNEKNNGKLQSIVQRLDEYALNELPTEEKLMQAAGYKNLESHLSHHKLFYSRLKQFKLEYKYNNPFLANNILHFLKKWLVSHILQEDRTCREILFEKGLIQKAQIFHNNLFPYSDSRVELGNYNIGIELIDRQQEVFMSIFNDISKLQNQKVNGEIQSIIIRLENFCSNELKKEEELLSLAGFKNYEEHIEQHKLFISRVNHFKVEYDYNHAFLASNILHFLKKWLITHIFNKDKEFRELAFEYNNSPNNIIRA